jgi:flavin-dependent dehydrogenase
LQAFIAFLQRAGWTPDAESVPWRGHAYLLRGSNARRTVGDGMVLAGDAAGYADANSGEGIYPAVVSGIAAAETIVEARGDYREGRLAGYGRRIQERLGRTNGGRGPRRLVPRSVEHALGRRLVAMPWFARHVVLERWFLHQ